MAEVDTLILRAPSSIAPEDREVLVQRYGFLACLAPITRGQRSPWRLVRPFAPTLIDRLAHNLGRRVVDFKPDPTVVDWLQNNVNLSHYDLIVGRYLMSLTKTGVLGKRPTLLDVDDLPTSMYEGRLTSPTTKPWEKLFVRKHLHDLKRILPKQWASVDALWVSKPGDVFSDAKVLPNVPWSDEGSCHVLQALPAATGSKQVLIVASFNHQPNIDGLNYFLEHVWPQVLAAEPKAVLNVVGNGMADALLQHCHSQDGVNPIGFVSDLRAAYQNCAFSVAPIFFGGGTNIKLLESFAYGRTCAATPQAVRGFDGVFEHETHLLISDSARSFANNCIRLLNDANLRESLAENASNKTTENYSAEHFCTLVAQRAQSLVRNGV